MTDGRAHTVLVIGEALIDIVDRGGERSRHVGGSPLNVAYGLGRLSIPTIFAGSVGADADGEAIIAHLASADVTLVRTEDASRRTSTALARIGADGSASYEFDLEWEFEQAPSTAGVTAVHVGSIGALRSPGAEGVLALVESLPDDVLVTFDPNIRDLLIPPVGRSRELVERYAARSAVVKLSDEDASWLYPDAPEEAASALLRSGARLVVVTRGGEGSSLYTQEHTVTVPARRIDVVDTIGAGDAYMSGLIGAIVDGVGGTSGLASRLLAGSSLSPADLERIGQVAAAAGSITVARAGAQPPSRAELDDVLAGITSR